MSLQKARLESAKLMAGAIDNLGSTETEGAAASESNTDKASPAVTNFVLRAFKIELLRYACFRSLTWAHG